MRFKILDRYTTAVYIEDPLADLRLRFSPR